MQHVRKLRARTHDTPDCTLRVQSVARLITAYLIPERAADRDVLLCYHENLFPFPRQSNFISVQVNKENTMTHSMSHRANDINLPQRWKDLNKLRVINKSTKGGGINLVLTGS